MKLSEFAKECRDTWKEDRSGVPVVGLEHLEPGEVKLSAWDVDSENTFTKRFNKGQVLLGRRRVYLRKAVVAPFDGICSGDITVIEAIPGKILPELLPFVIQNDAFFDYAEQGSAGSLSPRVKWEHLKDFEVNLPSIDDQKALAEKLWAAYRLKESYKKLLAATDEMVKSRFIEMFKHVYADGNVKTLAELVQDDRPITYGVIKPGAFVETGTYLVKVKDMCDGKINVDGLVKITPEVDSMYSRSKLKEGDILLSIRGTVGRVVIVPKELEGANITQDTARISLKIGLNNYYVKCVLESPTIQDWISMHICGLAVKGINLADVRKIPIPMADDSLQKDYVNIYHQADKSGLVN